MERLKEKRLPQPILIVSASNPAWPLHHTSASTKTCACLLHCISSFNVKEQGSDRLRRHVVKQTVSHIHGRGQETVRILDKQERGIGNMREKKNNSFLTSIFVTVGNSIFHLLPDHMIINFVAVDRQFFLTFSVALSVVCLSMFLNIFISKVLNIPITIVTQFSTFHTISFHLYHVKGFDISTFSRKPLTLLIVCQGFVKHLSFRHLG